MPRKTKRGFQVPYPGNCTLFINPDDDRNTVVGGKFDTMYNPFGADPTQATDANRPTQTLNALNGKTLATFDGSHYMDASGPMPTGDYTKIVVHKPSAFTTGNNMLSNSALNNHAFYLGGGAGNNDCSQWHGAAFNVSPRTTVSDEYEIAACTYVASSNAGVVFQNGDQVKTATAAADNAATGISWGSIGGAQAYRGTMGICLIYDFKMTPAQIKEVTLQLMRYYDILPNYRLVFEGDSLTLGSGVSSPDTYPEVVESEFGSQFSIVNSGTSGHSLVTGMNGGRVSISTNADDVDVLVIWGGYNDMAAAGDNQTAAAAYADLRTLVQNYASDGFYNIIVCTQPVALDTATTTKILSFNGLIRTNLTGDLATDGVKTIADIALLPEFDADGDYDDTDNYNADKIHLTEAGYALAAGVVKRAITQLMMRG